MTESDACALLKARFEKAGFEISENVAFDEDGIAFEVDGYDADKRVGYEYVTDEAGDSWDVGSDVIAALEAKRDAGELFILVVGEADAPDAAALGRAADLFLGQLVVTKPKAKPKKPAASAAPVKKAAAPKKKPTPKKKPVPAKKK
jgi:hypothetical protein